MITVSCRYFYPFKTRKHIYAVLGSWYFQSTFTFHNSAKIFFLINLALTFEVLSYNFYFNFAENVGPRRH